MHFRQICDQPEASTLLAVDFSAGLVTRVA